LRQSIVSAAVASALVAAPVVVLAYPLVRFFRVEPAVVDETVRFLRVVMLSTPGAAVVFVVASSLRGAGDTRTPLVIGAVVSILNIAAAYVLIYGRLGLPALGVVGA